MRLTDLLAAGSLDEQVTQTVVTVILAVVIAGICRNRGWSSALPLILVGVVISAAPFGPDSPRDPELMLLLVLAPLVFGEALTSSIVDLRRVRRPVVVMAVGLVVVGAFAVGMVAQLVVPGMWWSVAFALGAILGPTDAVAVSITAKQAGLPRRLVDILEGESLVNDGTALTLLRVFSVAAAAGSVTAAQTGLILATSVLGGFLVGAAGGAVLVWVIRHSRDVTVTNGIIIVAPFPIYGVAEGVEGSGILAVVVAALIVAHETSSAVNYSGRLQSSSMWRVLTFVLQATAFFIIGLEIPQVLQVLTDEQTRQLLFLVPAALVTLIAARALFVAGMTAVSRTYSVRSPYWIVAAWAGTRGPISGLAAFTLPLQTDAGQPIPDRNLAISTTFIIVVLSLLLAPTVAPLARALGLRSDDDTDTIRRVRVNLARAALDRLEDIAEAADRADAPMDPVVLDRLRKMTTRRLEKASTAEEKGHRAARDANAAQARQIPVEMFRAEQEELIRMRDEEQLPDALVRGLQKEIDVRIRAIDMTGQGS